MKNIRPIVLSYNLPEETDRIHEQLQACGFTDPLVVDNGSDQCAPATSANLLLPWNIRSAGQTKIALTYCMDYFPADFYWLITTSAVLYDYVDYGQNFAQALDDLARFEVGVLMPALDSAKAQPPQRYGNEDVDHRYMACGKVEPVAILVAHRLASRCRERGSAWFEPSFTRGWGCDYELCHEAYRARMCCVVDHGTPIGWSCNVGFFKGLGGEPLRTYHEEAHREMKQTLSRKYGRRWDWRFRFEFSRRIARLKWPYDVSFGVNKKNAA